MARPIVFVVAACGVIATAPVLAQDVVRFGGGDRPTGEVKGLERGKLSFDTDATGTIDIEWENVESIASNQFFEAWTAAGVGHFGTPSEGAELGVVSVTSPSGVVALRMAEVVRSPRSSRLSSIRSTSTCAPATRSARRAKPRS
jgi:hypothetical protein